VSNEVFDLKATSARGVTIFCRLNTPKDSNIGKIAEHCPQARACS
jgi:hypothetical protein